MLADNRKPTVLLVREGCPGSFSRHSCPDCVLSGIPLASVQEKYQQDKARVKPFEPLLLITDIDFDLVAKIEGEIMRGRAWKLLSGPSELSRKRAFAHTPVMLAMRTSRKWPTTRA